MKVFLMHFSSTRACPECRVTSDFVCPSMYWVDTKEDKEKLIVEYKNALSRKDCKYFKKGQGKCPFGNKCFYLHAFPDGSICDVGPPPRSRRRNGRNGRNNISVLQVNSSSYYFRINKVSYSKFIFILNFPK